MEYECEKCELSYKTGPQWEDECFCARCYHEMYGCPEWCEWADCPE